MPLRPILPPWLILGLAPLAAPTLARAGFTVDLNPPQVRGIALSPKAENWSCAEGRTATRRFGDVTVTFQADAGAVLSPVTDKATLDYPAPMAADGLTVKKPAGAAVDMIVRGLAPGAHSLALFLNSYGRTAPLAISVNGAAPSAPFEPAQRATDDQDLACAYLPVVAAAGQDVVVHIQPASGAPAASFVICGFAVDITDPHTQANKPSPADEDLHWDNAAPLTWHPAANIRAHAIYLGTDANAVATADTHAPEFKGAYAVATYRLPALSNFADYYWRVDEVDAENHVTRGKVWHFRVTHLAFPTAEGYGRFAIGGRGGKVLEVTNLEDYGAHDAPIPGSFRAAVEANFPRTIVFRVSGIIWLKSPCAVHNPFCTIAGQTAPGDGICLANFSSGAFGTHDVIIRYVHFRVGDHAQKAMDGAGLGSCDHCIIDHCSISWSSDEGTSSRGAKNITFQRNIVAEALQHGPHYNAADRSKFEPHAFAGSISGDVGSYHHNLLADCTDRNWSLAGGLTQGGKYAGCLDIRNNVVYNWLGRTTDGGVRALNYVNNYYKPYRDNRFATWLLRLDRLNPAWGSEAYYMNGNVLEGYVDENHNWDAFAYSGTNDRAEIRAIEHLVRVDHELYPSFVKTQTAAEAYHDVLANVGANFPHLDAIDAHVIKDVRDGTAEYIGTRGPTYLGRPGPNSPGIIDTQTDDLAAKGSPNFPWPEYKTYNVPVDSDHDGIPDAWEIAHGLNPHDPADANQDLNGDGYTNLEKYLNSIVGEYRL